MIRFNFACLSALLLVPCFILAQDDPNESKVAHSIELLGGKITTEDALPGRHVVGINLDESNRLTNGYLHLLKAFPNLKKLRLSKTTITDEGLKDIGKLKSLTELEFGNMKITDVGLSELIGLENLKALYLNGTSTSDDGLKEISKLTSLTKLNLYATRVTDDGLKEIGKLTNLTSLDLMSTQITDNGLKEL